MTPIFCSFYTPAYAPDARELKATLDAFDLPSDIRPMPDAGDWKANCAAKPGFIAEMMREHAGRPVVWLDADARIRERPTHFDSLTCDLAAHWRNGSELLTGTVYLSGSDASVALASDWATACQANPDRLDQDILSDVLMARPGISVSQLPSCYTCIYDDPAMGPAVIEHTQASRRLSTVHVWFAIPSALPPQECHDALARWSDLGYKTAVFRDADAQPVSADIMVSGEYPGYAKSVNLLVREILARDPFAAWIVTGGDDVHPVPDHAPGDIAAQCTEHFGGTLGVMEPCGDRDMVNEHGLCAAQRVCISPWMGRAWCERGYQGHGPLCTGYFHYYVDEELKNVTEKLGILWQRSDLMQFHDRWNRKPGAVRPTYLLKAQGDWAKAKALFFSRKEAGFPGSEPL